MPVERSPGPAVVEPTDPAEAGSEVVESARDAVVRVALAWQVAHRPTRRSDESAMARLLHEQEREDADWSLHQAIDALRAAGAPGPPRPPGVAVSTPPLDQAVTPLWVAHPELRPLAEQFAAASRWWPLAALERADPLAVLEARGAIERQVLAVAAAGWRPPPTPAGTVDELEALPPGAMVTDADGHVWVSNRVGEWCGPYPSGIDPDELLADGPVTVHHVPLTGVSADAACAATVSG